MENKDEKLNLLPSLSSSPSFSLSSSSSLPFSSSSSLPSLPSSSSSSLLSSSLSLPSSSSSSFSLPSSSSSSLSGLVSLPCSLKRKLDEVIKEIENEKKEIESLKEQETKLYKKIEQSKKRLKLLDEERADFTIVDQVNEMAAKMKPGTWYMIHPSTLFNVRDKDIEEVLDKSKAEENSKYTGLLGRILNQKFEIQHIAIKYFLESTYTVPTSGYYSGGYTVSDGCKDWEYPLIDTGDVYPDEPEGKKIIRKYKKDFLKPIYNDGDKVDIEPDDEEWSGCHKDMRLEGEVKISSIAIRLLGANDISEEDGNDEDDDEDENDNENNDEDENENENDNDNENNDEDENENDNDNENNDKEEKSKEEKKETK